MKNYTSENNPLIAPDLALSEKELVTLKAHFAIANQGCGAKTVEDLLGDNYSWATHEDLVEATPYNKNQISGILGSLQRKGILGKEDKRKETNLKTGRDTKLPDLYWLPEEYLNLLDPKVTIADAE